ncbi:MAG: DUF2961 domain-containing protein [Candidatus Aminicenantes bacterium]|nr:DUF2961 domain-containing protein [Candidatus Aminicenantes bacterium]
MFPLIPVLTVLISFGAMSADEGPVRDLSWFLRQMRSLDRLPALEASHTAMSSTWDRTGANADGSDFKRIESDGRNILLDVDGPGCVHRLFVGRLSPEQAGTRIQVYLDGAETPIFDLPILEFFDDEHGPIPYPLVFFKSYPGTLFPIPYSKHCRIQLVNPDYGKPDWNPRSWSNYWQLVYTTYPEGTEVKSLTWPPSAGERAEIEETSQAWLEAESGLPAFSEKPSVDRTWSLKAGETGTIRLEDCGIIRRMRVLVDPPTPESLLGLRLRISYDGAAWPSVDVPTGYFFGNAYAEGGREATSIAAVSGRRPTKRAAYRTDFFSLLMGSRGPEAYTCFPMPFARGAVLEFVNESAATLPRVRVCLDVEKSNRLPADWGRFHATWSEHRAATGAVPKFGPLNVPGNVVLDRRGRGKYVGVMLHLAWPDETWWGEGDWLIWTDEDAWPPSYHGTGSEEYFNSGWCQFDRKAVSGFVTLRPGHPTVYSFHLNDAFQFERSIRVVEEQMGGEPEAVRRISEEHPVWGATAFWYALPARPAESKVGPSWIGQPLSIPVKKP